MSKNNKRADIGRRGFTTVSAGIYDSVGGDIWWDGELGAVGRGPN